LRIIRNEVSLQGPSGHTGTNSVTVAMEAIRLSETSERLSTRRCRNPQNTTFEGRYGRSTAEHVRVTLLEGTTQAGYCDSAGRRARERPLDIVAPAAAALLYFPHCRGAAGNQLTTDSLLLQRRQHTAALHRTAPRTCINNCWLLTRLAVTVAECVRTAVGHKAACDAKPMLLGLNSVMFCGCQLISLLLGFVFCLD
jgi:hypothetical protein